MDWSDLEYFLRKTYIQSRSHSAPLINRENGLNLSYNGLLSKASKESLKPHRKILQMALDIYETIQEDDINEKILISDMIDHYGEEFVLILAKELNYPTVSGVKISQTKTNSDIIDKFMENLMESFNQKIDLESVQRTVDLADSILADIQQTNQKGGKSAENDEDIIGSICNNLKSTLSSVENIPPEAAEDLRVQNQFQTAKQLSMMNAAAQKSTNNTNTNAQSSNSYNPALQARKLLGAKRRFNDPQPKESSSGYRDEGRDINTEFKYYNMNKAPPATNTNSNTNNNTNSNATKQQKQIAYNPHTPANSDEPIDERLAGIEPRIIELIRNEIMHRVDNITWESIAGLEHAKNSIKEIVVWPMLRPDIFKGLRGPPKGLLLFGPPGTGKTMIGKCIANQAKATFFSISASSLTSKWVGEGEKMVRALFAVARCSQPAVIFIDEIDSLLTQRTDSEVEASRRIKTEFLVQFDGAGTNCEDRILVIGATNRPQEIDEAARRRLLKRLYIPLPESEARATIIKNLLVNQLHCLTDEDINWVCSKTDGYSGSDMDGLCREAAIGPIRSITDILNISTSDVRAISRKDFEEALSQVRASVSDQDLILYLDWNKKFGSLNVR